MDKLLYFLLQTLVVYASICLAEDHESDEPRGIRRLDKTLSSSSRYGRYLSRMPYSFGGFVPSFPIKGMSSDFPELDDHHDEHFHDDEPIGPVDDYEHDHSAYHGHHHHKKEKKHHMVLHKHMHEGHVLHKHKHDGDAKHHHKHEGHAHHEHKHEGHGKHEHKHLGHGEHEHKHKGKAEHDHHHKGSADHHHKHEGHGKHEHKHIGHAGHKHEHKGKAEHEHKHHGYADHKHHHDGKGKHEHHHHGHAGHKHEHKGHAEHGHKHIGHGHHEHKHSGHGHHDHKHHGAGHHEHKHHGVGHHDHKHHGSGHFDHKHKGEGHVSHKHESHHGSSHGHFFDSEDDTDSDYQHGFETDGFHSFNHKSDTTPNHPKIIFFGSDPDLYNFFVHKKEMMRKSRSQAGEKRIGEEPEEERDARVTRSNISKRMYKEDTSDIEDHYIPVRAPKVYLAPEREDAPVDNNGRQSHKNSERPVITYLRRETLPVDLYRRDEGEYRDTVNNEQYNKEEFYKVHAPRYHSQIPEPEAYRNREDEENRTRQEEDNEENRPIQSMNGNLQQEGLLREENEKPYLVQYSTQPDIKPPSKTHFKGDGHPKSTSRSLQKEGFLPEDGEKPHLIQYNVVHTDSKLPSMSYFSQLRAIT